MSVNRFEVMVQQMSKDGLVLSSVVNIELDRRLPAKKTLDQLDCALRNTNVRKIVIRKLSDYKEGDIF